MLDASGEEDGSASPAKREEEEVGEPEEVKSEPAPAAVAEEEEKAPAPRKARLPRACNSKPRPPPPPRPRRRAAAGGSGGGADQTPQCRVVTPLVSEPEAPAELPRWRLRCMSELGSVLNFLHVRTVLPTPLAGALVRGGFTLCFVPAGFGARVRV
jgi:hypothetical protein